MREPVAPVHRDEDQCDEPPTGHESNVRHDDPRQRLASNFGERDRERYDEWGDQRRVQDRVQEVLSVPPGEDGTSLGWTDPLHDEEDCENHEGRGPYGDYMHTAHLRDKLVAPQGPSPADRDENRRDHHNGQGWHVEA